MGFFDRFNDLSSNILLTFGCFFDNPQCSGVGHLNGNSQLSSNAPPMPGLPPPQRLNIDRCITNSFMTTPSYFIINKDEKENIDLENIISQLFMESSREKATTKLLFSQKNCA